MFVAGDHRQNRVSHILVNLARSERRSKFSLGSALRMSFILYKFDVADIDTFRTNWKKLEKIDLGKL